MSAGAQGGRPRDPGGREWVGGLLWPPFFITDRDEPYRPGLVAWMEVRDGLVVGQEVVAPEDADGAVGRVLRAAMDRPLAGPPRRPDRIRVADASLAAEVRAALGDATPVEVGLTPELDELLEAMLESLPGEGESASYLDGGRLPPAAVAGLFASAQILYRLAPWKIATDDQVLRMDIPALGVEGACVSIIGNLGESLALLIFPSLAGYEAFGRAAGRLERGVAADDLGSDWLALSFERGADLPREMRREVAAHGWPVADAAGYPRVGRHDRDGTPRPLVERDLQVASACAASLAAFFVKYQSRFEVDDPDPVCESFFDERDVEVRFTMPYEAFELFDVAQAPESPPRPRRKAGRNEPCPCGSGKKYKKCHLPLERAEQASHAARAAGHDLDELLYGRLTEFAMARFGFEWRDFTQDFADARNTRALADPWSLYHYRVQGKTVAEWYSEELGRHLSRAQRGWLEAQQAAWLSVWEVIGVEPGRSVTLRDLLSGEERHVRETSASRTLVVRDALLARVVDHDDDALLCGVHPRPLPPPEAAEVVRRARGRLRRKRAVPVDRLRDEKFGRYLIRRWEEAVADFDAARAVPPDLRNTDGDPLLFTTDHYEIDPGAASTVAERLAAMDGVRGPEEGEDPPSYVVLRPASPEPAGGETTVIGQARLSGIALELETNSRQRADALRARVEAACGDKLRHRAREHTDPLSPKVAAAAAGHPAPEAPTPEMEQLVLEFKRRHYADWLDHPLPALGGETPRQAARTARGRAAVDVLLKDMENGEQRGPAGQAFDFSEMRSELRLD